MEEAVIALYANADYTTGTFFDYMTKELMLLKENDNAKTAKLIDGSAVLKPFSIPTNLFSQIGTNTKYNIHPEEICAEHFRLLILGETVPEPRYLTAMKNILN